MGGPVCRIRRPRWPKQTRRSSPDVSVKTVMEGVRLDLGKRKCRTGFVKDKRLAKDLW